MNGANCDDDIGYDPRPNSYDFGALLDEAGEPTAKYHAVRTVIAKYAPVGSLELLPSRPNRLGPLFRPFESQLALLKALPQLSKAHTTSYPLTMEMMDQSHGFILYETVLDRSIVDGKMEIRNIRDRAYVLVNRNLTDVLDRNDANYEITLNASQGSTLAILVENMGRVNFGKNMHDRKGITEAVFIEDRYHCGWRIYPLPLNSVGDLVLVELGESDRPSFYRSSLEVEQPLDTFVKVIGGRKGCCFVNNFNLGRYWARGPFQTLFCPKNLLKEGLNSFTVLELEAGSPRGIEFLQDPIVNHTAVLEPN